jgi:protein-disulfide isomerase
MSFLHGQWRLRDVLDTAATVAVIAAAGSVLLVSISAWRQGQQQAAAQVRPGQVEEHAIPKTPQTLADAETLGNPHAAVAIVEYSDFQCPFCGRFVSETWPAIKKEYVESGKVLAAFRHLPLEINAFAKPAAVRAACAGMQGKFWEMHDLLFEKKGRVTQPVLDDLVTQLPLDASAYRKCVANPSHENIQHDMNSAQTLGITGTPTFLIGIVKDNSLRVTNIVAGAQPFGRFKGILDRLLEKGS